MSDPVIYGNTRVEDRGDGWTTYTMIPMPRPTHKAYCLDARCGKATAWYAGDAVPACYYCGAGLRLTKPA